MIGESLRISGSNSIGESQLKSESSELVEAEDDMDSLDEPYEALESTEPLEETLERSLKLRGD